MSHFSTIKTTLSNRQALQEGLKALLEKIGITPEIESHENPVPLINGYDTADRLEANIIIRRTQLQGLIDIGFRWNPDQNCYEAAIDPWDFGRNLLGNHFENVEDFLEQVQIAHNAAFINIHYPAHLWSQETITASDGTMTTTLTKKVDLYA